MGTSNLQTTPEEAITTMHMDPNFSVLHGAKAQVDRRLQILYPLVSMCTRLPQGLQGRTPLLIRTRTFDALTFSFRKEVDAFNVFETVRELTVAGVHFLPFLKSLLSGRLADIPRSFLPSLCDTTLRIRL